MSKAKKHSSEQPNAEIAGKVQRIELNKLLYDPTNPRVVERLRDKPTQAQIEDLLLGGEFKARELVPSFIENGYIPYEPLIVRPVKNQFVVVEGSRRLAALRSMEKSDDKEEKAAFERHKLAAVPCLVFEGDERQLLAYLGLRHLSKTKDWGTRAKGAFVERVLNNGHSIQEAGRLTNTTTSALRLIMLTRRLFEEANSLALNPADADPDGETVFWRLGDAIRRTRTKAYLKLEENPDPRRPPSYDQTRFENLITWIYGNPKRQESRIIASIRDIATLDECLANASAIRVLESGASLERAKEELQQAGQSIIGHLERAKRSVERACAGEFSKVDAQGLDEIDAAAQSLKSAVNGVHTLLNQRRDELGSK